MIEYFRGPYGANLLFRWHGSALAKSFVPGTVGVAIYLSLHFVYAYDHDDDIDVDVNYHVVNPYAIGVLVTSVSFLITFRANYGYQRYWEACGSVHQLMGKWMDATTFSGVFHMQCDHYDDMRPPSFHDYHDLNHLGMCRDRERIGHKSKANANDIDAGGGDTRDVDRQASNERDEKAMMSTLRNRRYRKSINETRRTVEYRTEHGRENVIDEDDESDTIDEGRRLLGTPRLDGGWGLLYPDDDDDDDENDGADASSAGHSRGDGVRDINSRFRDVQRRGRTRGQGRTTTTTTTTTTMRRSPSLGDRGGFESRPGGRTPSLFLQELTHLSSLLVAVAMSTLRHDAEDAEPPLGRYVPGMTWPAADPRDLPRDVRRSAEGGISGTMTRNIRYALGMDQTRSSRTKYNAARPMLVLGGVSDDEMSYLMRARGPYAKTQLAWGWLSDFMLRESMAGSMGNVAPPIISRLFQFMSDGMTHYNHALKITYVPFPFPHAQLSAFFVLTMVVAIPFLMDQYVNHAWLGGTLTFLTVTCLAGLHEVARELETPFRSVPNDVPLCTLMAFYNETLITTFAGFHPDAYWKMKADDILKNLKEQANDGYSKSSTEPGVASVNLTVEGQSLDDEISIQMPKLPVSSNGLHNERDVSLSPHLLPVLPNHIMPTSPSCLPHRAPAVDEDRICSLSELRKAMESQSSKIRDLQERLLKKKEEKAGKAK